MSGFPEEVLQRDFAGSWQITGGNHGARVRDSLQFDLLLRAQEEIRQDSLAARREVDPSQVDRFRLQATTFGEPGERREITDEDDHAVSPFAPDGEVPPGIGNAGEDRVHGWRNTQAIQLLFPAAGAEIVVDDDDAIHVQALAPPDDDLTVDQAFVNAK
jgi:hypothetical protein